jgi:carbon starvation protein
MNVLYLLLLSMAILYLASRFYGRLVSRWLGEDSNRPTPAVELNDGRDYAPANSNVLFGHHFATIAGAGPIVGPTLAVLYGYLPVWLWIIIGGVLFGAVHDFSTLFVSLRERGRSIAEIARGTLGDRGFALFIGFAAVMIILVTSAFLAMTAMSLTSMETLQTLGLEPGQRLLRVDPASGKAIIGGIASTSVIVITVLAPLLGWLLYRRRIHALLGYALAIVICLGAIALGFRFPVTLSPQVWMIVISVYVLFAAGVPVWIILQPRDFVNVQILYAGIIAMLVGLVVGGAFQGMTLQMPPLAIGEGTARMGLLWPMLFITVACGAISRFRAQPPAMRQPIGV